MPIYIGSAAYDQLVKERITNTSMATSKGGEYNQCTFISQAAINQQLYDMWAAEESLRNIYVELSSGESLIAQCDPPTIKLALNGISQKVTFYINMRSGTFGGLRIVMVKGRPVVEERPPISVSGWTIAFNVDLAMEQLDRKDVPESIKNQLLNFDDYSIYQLMVDFTTADIANYIASESVFVLQDSNRDAFNQLMIQYVGDLKGGNKKILNYLPKRERGVGLSVAPTLVPTSLNFMTLPFHVGSGIIPDAEKGKYGMLAYLQMTDGHAPPQDLLMDTANWVMPPRTASDPSYDGTVALSKKVFLDGWLLPKLAYFNQVSTWWVDEAWWKGTDPLETGLFGTKYMIRGHMGLSEAEKNSIGGVGWVEQPRAAGATERTWKYSCHRRIDDDHGLWRVYQDGQTNNVLTVPDGLGSDGKSTIMVSGSTRVENHVHLDGIGEWGKSYGVVTNDWSCKLILDGTQNGRLIIDGQSISSNVTQHADNSFLYPSIINNMNTQLAKLMNNGRMATIAEEVEGYFCDTWQFIFSGSREFYIDCACFNSEGDLLCELKYKSYYW